MTQKIEVDDIVMTRHDKESNINLWKGSPAVVSEVADGYVMVKAGVASPYAYKVMIADVRFIGKDPWSKKEPLASLADPYGQLVRDLKETNDKLMTKLSSACVAWTSDIKPQVKKEEPVLTQEDIQLAVKLGEKANTILAAITGRLKAQYNNIVQLVANARMGGITSTAAQDLAAVTNVLNFVSAWTSQTQGPAVAVKEPVCVSPTRLDALAAREVITVIYGMYTEYIAMETPNLVVCRPEIIRAIPKLMTDLQDIADRGDPKKVEPVKEEPKKPKLCRLSGEFGVVRAQLAVFLNNPAASGVLYDIAEALLEKVFGTPSNLLRASAQVLCRNAVINYARRLKEKADYANKGQSWVETRSRYFGHGTDMKALNDAAEEAVMAHVRDQIAKLKKLAEAFDGDFMSVIQVMGNAKLLPYTESLVTKYFEDKDKKKTA